VVLTEDARRRLSEILPGTPICVLRNPVLVDEMQDSRGVPRGDADLLYLGWFIRAKGVYELVDAVEILRRKGTSVRLSLYGIKEAERLKQYVRDRSSPDVVRVNGWIGDEEKLAALHAATMLVLPSHSEGIPNVILEAMATRTPIVATSVGGLKEVLRDGENSLVARVKDPVDLSEKIARLLADKGLRTRLAENAFQEASEKYDARIIKDQFIRIIDGVM
jgi:glycosyltransferase involved in cell wall biosynthesis